MTGVEAKTNLAAPFGGIRDRVPKPGDRIQPTGHSAVAAGGVLDQHRQRAVDSFYGLTPAVVSLLKIDVGRYVTTMHDEALGTDRGSRVQLLLEQFAARNPDPVVRRRDVDDIGRVDVAVDISCLECCPK